MGSTYANVVIKNTDQQSVVDHFNPISEQFKIPFIISPEVDGSVLVAVESMTFADPRGLDWLATNASEIENTVALAAFQHDEDVLILAAAARGEHVQFYFADSPMMQGAEESMPSMSRDGDAIAKVFGHADKAAEVSRILQAQQGLEGSYVFESQRHAELLDILGLPVLAAGWGYEYVKAQDYDADFDHNEVVELPL